MMGTINHLPLARGFQAFQPTWLLRIVENMLKPSAFSHLTMAHVRFSSSIQRILRYSSSRMGVIFPAGLACAPGRSGGPGRFGRATLRGGAGRAASRSGSASSAECGDLGTPKTPPKKKNGWGNIEFLWQLGIYIDWLFITINRLNHPNLGWFRKFMGVLEGLFMGGWGCWVQTETNNLCPRMVYQEVSTIDWHLNPGLRAKLYGPPWLIILRYFETISCDLLLKWFI